MHRRQLSSIANSRGNLQRKWAPFIVGVFLLAACAGTPGSDSDGTSTTAGDGSPGSSTQTSGGTAAPGSEDATLVYAIADDPLTLDAHFEGSSEQKQVIDSMFDTLTTLNSAQEVEPGIATDWSVSDDNLTWTFHLRDDIVFHDGEPLDAEAVKFSIDRVLDEDLALPAREHIGSIVESVTVVDATTVELHLFEPWAPMPLDASQLYMAIVSPTAVEAMGDDFGLHPVGSGPFKFKEWRSGQQIVVERNEDYWGQTASLQEIVFQIVPEPSTRVALLETGDADLAMLLPVIDVERLRADDAYDVYELPEMVVITFRINMLNEKFQDVRVRQALQYAVNPQEVIDTVLEGQGRLATGPFPSGVPGKFETPVPYDPEAARALLAEAGYADGLDVVITYRDDPEIMQAFQGQLAAAGINATLEQLDSDAYRTHNRLEPDDPAAAEKELTDHGSTYDYPDPQFLRRLYTSSGFPPNGNNYGYFASDEIDELLARGQVESDPDARFAIYQQAQQLLIDEAPSVWLYEPIFFYASRGLTGVELSPNARIAWQYVVKT